MIDYLRISVTDRCNFRCFYCRPTADYSFIPHEEVLRYEEIIKVVKILKEFGINKVRLTGGEPLLRKDIEFLVKELKHRVGILKVYITTNGFFLKEKAESLIAAGIDGINVSLDTLNPKKFTQITRVENQKVFFSVIEGINFLKSLKFENVKINSVLLKGINDNELFDLVLFAKKLGFLVRFIELMSSYSPIETEPLKTSFVIDYFKKYGKISKIKKSFGNGPAVYFQVETKDNEILKFGLIESLGHDMCERCNRMRLTSDGKLMRCLFEDSPVSLKEIIREHHNKKLKLEHIIKKIVDEKKSFKKLNRVLYQTLKMNKIGG